MKRASPAADLPLSALLSQALVAFIIEFDNEFEHQVPHRTTDFASGSASSQAPWLVSMAMWVSFMQFVSDDGVTVHELRRRMRVASKDMRWWLMRMAKWWSYVAVRPDPTEHERKPSPSQWVVRPTAGGRRALEVWRPLSGTIEERWKERFGEDAIKQLRTVLSAVAGRLDPGLPDFLPILAYGLFTRRTDVEPRTGTIDENRDISQLGLPALLSRVLLALALEYENGSELSLAISANVLRVLDAAPTPLGELPRLSGVAKPAIDMAMGVLQKARMAVVEQGPPGTRGKVGRLTPKGQAAREAYHGRLVAIEDSWRARFGADEARNLRNSLQHLVGMPTEGPSPLLRGLVPHPDGWRASVPRPDTLPHYPTILHRGGFPDGS